jgi:hypothetical protein
MAPPDSSRYGDPAAAGGTGEKTAPIPVRIMAIVAGAAAVVGGVMLYLNQYHAPAGAVLVVGLILAIFGFKGSLGNAPKKNRY